MNIKNIGVLAIFVLALQPALAFDADDAIAIAQSEYDGEVFSVSETNVLYRWTLRPAYQVGIDMGTSSIKYVFVSEDGEILRVSTLLKGRVVGGTY